MTGPVPVTTQRACDRCGAGFTPARADARYCTARCRQAAYRHRQQGDRTARRRRPLPEAWFDAAYDLRKAAERIDRLMADDRFPAAVAKLHERNGYDLEVVARVLATYTSAVTGQPSSDGCRAGATSAPASVTGQQDSDGCQEGTAS
jgi:hypothetical protein